MSQNNRKACIGGSLAGLVLIVLGVLAGTIWSRSSFTCPSGFSVYTLTRDLTPTISGYPFTLVNASNIDVMRFTRTQLPPTVDAAPLSESGLVSATMTKSSFTAVLVPTYTISIGGGSGTIGMNVLGFIDRYTTKVTLGGTAYTFTTKDTWGFKTLPGRFKMVDSNNNVYMEINQGVSILKEWNVCTAPEASKFEQSLLFCAAVAVAIHD